MQLQIRIRKRLRERQGISVVFALVSLLVISLACLTLFHTTYSMVGNSKNYQASQQAEILASSINDSIAEAVGEAREKNITTHNEIAIVKLFNSLLGDTEDKTLDGHKFFTSKNETDRTIESDISVLVSEISDIKKVKLTIMAEPYPAKEDTFSVNNCEISIEVSVEVAVSDRYKRTAKSTARYRYDSTWWTMVKME